MADFRRVRGVLNNGAVDLFGNMYVGCKTDKIGNPFSHLTVICDILNKDN